MNDNSPPPPILFKDYVKLTHWLTARMMRTAKVRGIVVDADDLHQEVSMIWIACVRLYKPEHGKFSNYYARSAFMAFNQGHLVRHIVGKQPLGATISMNSLVGEGGEDGSSEFGDLLADETIENPEERLLRADSVREELEANPVLHRLVQLSTTPPPEFLAELKALAAQQEYARELGLPVRERIPTALTPDIIRQIFRFNWRQRKLAMTEGVPA